jgi:hypothetical protein
MRNYKMAGYMPKEIKEIEMKKSKGLPEPMLEWKRKQKPGAIMKPETFKNIEAGAMDKYGAKRAEKIAGGAYQKTLKAKYKESKKK